MSETAATIENDGGSDLAATPDTRERLIEAGMYVFARDGFAAASVRDICARAEANAAAVNYHFGDKERFYAEVLVSCHRRAAGRRHMPRLEDRPAAPREVLRAWIRWMLELLLVESAASPLGQLMAREMFAPTPAFDELVRRNLLPMYLALGEIVAAVLGREPGPALRLEVNSVLGQCLFYKHAQPAIERLGPLIGAPEPAGEDLDVLALHVADFSLAGLDRRSEAKQ